MANSKGDALIDTVRARAGRSNDSVLITEAFVLDALNEAQLHIVRKMPRQLDLDKSDRTTYRISSAKTVAIGGCARSSNVVTVTTSAIHYMMVDQKVLLEDVDSGSETNAFSGEHTIVSVPTTTTFTIAQTGADESNLAAGTATAFSIPISTLNPAHIGGIWILNGGDTRQSGIKYKPLKEFRREYIPVEEESTDEWTYYTRQGSHLIFNCPLGSDYNGLYLRIDYTDWATALANNNSTDSDMENSDKGLILFALAEVYDEIALSVPKFEAKALKTRALFNNWLLGYQDYNDMCLETLYDD